MLISLLLSCSPVTEPLPEVVCDPGPGEVQWIEGRRRFGSLSRALEQGGLWQTLCLGEGDFELDEDFLEIEELTGSIHLLGRGPELTRIVASSELDTGFQQLLWPGRPLELVFEGLEIAVPLELHAESLVLDTVTLQDLDVSAGLLRIDAREVRLQDLLVQGCYFGFGGLTFAEDLDGGAVQINGLRWLDNVSAAGLHFFVEGERGVRFRNLVVENAADLSSGYPMFYGFGDMEIRGGSLFRARGAGPLLSARVLRLSDVEVLEGRSSSGGLIQVAQGLFVERSSFQDSRAQSGLLTAYKGSLFPVDIEILDSQFGTQLPNSVLCDLSVAGQCVVESFGAVEQWSCRDCTESLAK